MKGTDTKTDYRKLAEKYLSIAKQVTEELQANKDVIGCAVIGSTARGDVHPLLRHRFASISQKERYIPVGKENRPQHCGERGTSFSRRS